MKFIDLSWSNISSWTNTFKVGLIPPKFIWWSCGAMWQVKSSLLIWKLFDVMWEFVCKRISKSSRDVIKGPWQNKIGNVTWVKDRRTIVYAITPNQTPFTRIGYLWNSKLVFTRIFNFSWSTVFFLYFIDETLHVSSKKFLCISFS